jgi:hypothetical protein
MPKDTSGFWLDGNRATMKPPVANIGALCTSSSDSMWANGF